MVDDGSINLAIVTIHLLTLHYHISCHFTFWSLDEASFIKMFNETIVISNINGVT